LDGGGGCDTQIFVLDFMTLVNKDRDYDSKDDMMIRNIVKRGDLGCHMYTT
jgi:hypothetical protein